MVFGILLAGIIGGSIGSIINGGTEDEDRWRQSAEDEIAQEQFQSMLDNDDDDQTLEQHLKVLQQSIENEETQEAFQNMINDNKSVSSISSLGPLNSTWSAKMEMELSRIEDNQLEQEKLAISQSEKKITQDNIERFIDQVIDGERALVFNFVNKNIENYRHILYYPSTQKYGGSCLIRLYKSIKRTAEYILLLLVKLKTARGQNAKEIEKTYNNQFVKLINLITISYVLRGWNGIDNMIENPSSFKAIQNHKAKIPSQLIFDILILFIADHKKIPKEVFIGDEAFGGIEIHSKKFTRVDILSLLINFLHATAIMDSQLDRSYIVNGETKTYPLPINANDLTGYASKLFQETIRKLGVDLTDIEVNILLPKIEMNGTTITIPRINYRQ